MSKASDNSSKPLAVRLTNAGNPIADNQNSLSAGPRVPLRSIRWPWRKLQLLRLLMRLGKWRRTLPETEVVLLRDAEFRVALSELRYPPIGTPTHAVPGGYPPRPSVPPVTDSSIGHTAFRSGVAP
jgi:hypothetical protein